jgi:hypothetical protein
MILPDWIKERALTKENAFNTFNTFNGVHLI